MGFPNILTIYKEGEKVYVLDGRIKAEAFVSKNKVTIGAPLNYKGKYLEDTDQLLLNGTVLQRFDLLYQLMPMVDSDNTDTLTRAHELLDSLLQRYPSTEKFLLLMGNTKYKLNDSPEEALGYFEKALEVFPFEGNFNIGCVYLEHERPAESLFYFHLALKRKPGNFSALNNLSDAYFKLNEPDSAIHYYRKSICATEDSVRGAFCLYRIGVCYGKMKNDLDSAIHYISLALSLDSTKNYFYEDLGVAHGFKKEYENAILVLKKGVQNDSSYAKFYYNLAVTYEHLGQEEKMKEYYDKAYTLDPALKKEESAPEK